MAIKKQKKIVFRIVNYILLVLIISFIFLFFFSRPIEVKTLEVRFEVGDRLGISSGKGLDFGEVLSGSSSTKNLAIQNNFDFPIEVDLFIDNELKDYLFADSGFIVKSGETISVPIILVLPNEVLIGEYSGILRLEISKI